MTEVFPQTGGGSDANNPITSPDSEARELAAGSNITFDTATPGILEISASGGGGGNVLIDTGFESNINTNTLLGPTVSDFSVTNTGITISLSGDYPVGIVITGTIDDADTMSPGTITFEGEFAIDFYSVDGSFTQGDNQFVVTPVSGQKTLVTLIKSRIDENEVWIVSVSSASQGNWKFGNTETTQSGDYSVLENDRFILYDGTGGHTFTLPASPTLGETHTFLHYGSGNLTIDGNGKTVGANNSITVGASFGGYTPITIVYIGDNGSGAYNWLLSNAFNTDLNTYLGKRFEFFNELTDAYRYRLYTDSTPATTVTIEIKDPGANTQLGLVDPAGIVDGNLPVWVDGSGGGGYFVDSGIKIPVKGKATLSGGTVTVSTSAAHPTSNIQLTAHAPGGIIGILSVGTIVDNISFVINSSSALDTSDVDWIIFN